jgi:hypothetical protein
MLERLIRWLGRKDRCWEVGPMCASYGQCWVLDRTRPFGCSRTPRREREVSPFSTEFGTALRAFIKLLLTPAWSWDSVFGSGDRSEGVPPGRISETGGSERTAALHRRGKSLELRATSRNHHARARYTYGQPTDERDAHWSALSVCRLSRRSLHPCSFSIAPRVDVIFGISTAYDSLSSGAASGGQGARARPHDDIGIALCLSGARMVSSCDHSVLQSRRASAARRVRPVHRGGDLLRGASPTPSRMLRAIFTSREE